jgi:tRNA G18 (ribose-2'-O)-methylase SpoU
LPRRRVEDVEAIRAALDRSASDPSPISLLLCREGELSPTAGSLVARARELDIPVLIESEREMRRMSSGEAARELVALEGFSAHPTLDELMSRQGLVFVLVGIRYPGNVGFILRSAEVAGAAGVVLASDWEGSQLSEALRVGMRADRFFPVIESAAEAAIAAARRAGRRVVALETAGAKAPWNADLVAPTVVLVGSETMGISDALLESADDIIRIPTRGFIPSYNVQAAVGMLLGEWLRQNVE